MEKVKQQWHYFLTALMFFTRIPCNAPFNQNNLNRCNRYFPIIGVIVGGIGVAVYWASSLLFPLPVAVLLSMTATILTTGAFHEDGFADVCDGFGGGWNQERILLIMKDSRVGAYGAIGIILILATKFALLSEMNTTVAILSIFTAHVLSRGITVTTMWQLIYVSADASSKSKPIAENINGIDVFIAFSSSLLPLLLWPSFWFLIVPLPAIIIKWFLERWFKKWIGGYTGDCLGTVQQVSEIVIYLTITAIAKFVII